MDGSTHATFSCGSSGVELASASGHYPSMVRSAGIAGMGLFASVNVPRGGIVAMMEQHVQSEVVPLASTVDDDGDCQWMSEN
jgi:hypothetical protein